jgi:hypothetical protein
MPVNGVRPLVTLISVHLRHLTCGGFGELDSRARLLEGLLKPKFAVADLTSINPR